MVPVLSKQQTSTRPANEILKGSVQKIAKEAKGRWNRSVEVNGCEKEREKNEPYFERATREALTAIDNSIGSSGGTTEVTIRTQSRRSLDVFIPFSTPKRKESEKHISSSSRDASRA